ncbi:hydroxyacid oxidase 2 isoform X2 [Onychostruthus taczanowskii]|uniref:hydroxyacid oxidase 2 isoform X2 n=1 Tax=Onychostruthus taczanowskii TaxID=356909 RepID=UPI001B8043B2|nr:hydroxyacid oxidase 2 isoform X2 [Onychostruthus taczanowskii]
MAMVCLSDFEAYAKKYLPKIAWDYFAAGADDCTTRDENILAYKRIHFRPRMLRDVSVMDIRTKILGSEISFPVGIAPTGFHQLAWPDGEKSTARAARAMDTCYIASTYSTCTLEEISAAAPGGLRWFQLYIHRNRAASQQLVQRAEALGFQGLVLTADLPYTGKRRDDVRNGFRLPPHMKVKNLEAAFEIDALVEVVEAVGGRVEVYVDGGIRKGSDVLKALALGAKCVFIGRPALWGLAYKGEEGLQDVLRILQDEFRLSMALAGCASVSEIGQHLVQFSRL